jgi:hypothetical protein
MVNGGTPFMHTLPSRNACGNCHEENKGTVASPNDVIGFDELRLNSKFKADDTKTQLQTFADKGVFKQAIPTDPASVTDNTVGDMGRLLRIKRFVLGNCVHCHNGTSLPDFHPEIFAMVTVNKPVPPTQSVMPPPGYLRIAPKHPEKSVVYLQVQQTMLPAPVNGVRLRPMPPVGVADQGVNQEALKDLFDWICALPGTGVPGPGCPR